MPDAASSEPLHGRRVAVTRPASDADQLATLLRLNGAVPVILPLVGVEAATDLAPVAAAISRLSTYDWVVFTSANAVRVVQAELRRSGTAAGVLPRRTAAVGPATARAVVDLLGWSVDVVPDDFIGAALPAAMAAVAPLRGARVLWPRAAAAQDVLPRELTAAGAKVDAPVAYRTVAHVDAARELTRLLSEASLDVVTFTSPSAVNCLASISTETGAAVVAVIGASTAAAARQKGLPVHVEPGQHTIPALVDALREFLRERLATDVEGREEV
jgi:uroporphyrinogen III methyltransferase / synthase